MVADDAVMQFMTPCSSAEEFIDRFGPATTEADIVVPAPPEVTAGTTGPFVICLTDRSVMLKGRCEVAEIFAATVEEGRAPTPPLMRLRLRELDAHSCGIHLRLMERCAKTGTDAVPIAAPAVDQSAVTVVGGARPSMNSEITVISPPQPPPAPPAAPDPPAGVPAGRGRRIGRRFAVHGSVLIVGVSLGLIVRPVVVRPVSKSPPVTVVAQPSPPPVAVPPAVPSAVPPAPPADEIGDPPPYDCVARVKTKPAGAEVFWGDISLGRSPIRHAAIPCGEANVKIRRERYEDVTRKISAERRRKTVIVQRLQHPVATLVVISSPPRAFIKLNRHRLGRAPREIAARRFERVRIEASLPGYRPWKKTLVLDEEESAVDVKLARIHDRNGREAADQFANTARFTVSASF